MHHIRPATSELPATWIESKPLPDGEGIYASWIVLRKVDGYHPFVTHRAHWNDDHNCWEYGNGHYFEKLENAVEDFGKRG